MSVYGGFLTKKQSAHYYVVLEDIIKIVQNVVIDSLTKNIVDYDSFREPFLKSYKKLEKLEIRKYMQPKYSLSLKPLFDICFDHAFFPQKVFEVSQDLQTNNNNSKAQNFKNVDDIKRSIDLNSKSLLISEENPFESIEKWRLSKSKTFRERKSLKIENAVVGLSNELSTLAIDERPNTTGTTSHRRNRSIPVSGRLGNYLKEPKTARKELYQSFEKEYMLPAPTIDYEKKLFALRKGNRVKYEISQLF